MITTKQKRDEILREIGVRERFYPGWVQAGKLSAHTAELRIAILRSLLLDLEAKLEDEKEPTLFD